MASATFEASTPSGLSPTGTKLRSKEGKKRSHKGLTTSSAWSQVGDDGYSDAEWFNMNKRKKKARELAKKIGVSYAGAINLMNRGSLEKGVPILPDGDLITLEFGLSKSNFTYFPRINQRLRQVDDWEERLRPHTLVCLEFLSEDGTSWAGTKVAYVETEEFLRRKAWSIHEAFEGLLLYVFDQNLQGTSYIRSEDPIPSSCKSVQCRGLPSCYAKAVTYCSQNGVGARMFLDQTHLKLGLISEDKKMAWFSTWVDAKEALIAPSAEEIATCRSLGIQLHRNYLRKEALLKHGYPKFFRVTPTDNPKVLAKFEALGLFDPKVVI